MRDRRVGRFRIDFATINDRPEVARAVLAGLIVVRAEAIWPLGHIAYFAISPEFAGVAPGDQAPDYGWQIVEGHRKWVAENDKIDV